jgi:FtsH-binding integral membrane protein
MTSPATPEARMRSVKLIHGALTAGVVLFLLVTAWVHRVTPPAPLLVSGPLLPYVGLGMLAAGLLGLRVLPGPDPAPAPGQTTDQWWMKSQGRLLVRWAVVEGGCLVNAVLWYLSRDRVSLVAAIAGLAVLLTLRPSRYLE